MFGIFCEEIPEVASGEISEAIHRLYERIPGRVSKAIHKAILV